MEKEKDRKSTGMKKKKKQKKDKRDEKSKKSHREKKKDREKRDHLDVGHHEETNIRVGNFQMLEAIGKGGFGVVYRGLNLDTGATVAVKRVPLHGIPKEELDGIQTEIELLKNLSHANIVKYVDAIRTEDFLNIILEFVENGALSNMLGRLLKTGHVNEQLVAVYTAQILDGLRYLHEQGVIHRDIKGANILSTKDGVVKLADFGVATKLNDSKKSDSVVGTPYWMAPEIIEMTGQQSSACDIWSVGCTVVELLTGKPPYFDLQQMPALFRIVQDEHPPLPDGIAPALEDFLMQCFQKDPLRRVTAAELLKHPWLKSAREVSAIERAKKASMDKAHQEALLAAGVVDEKGNPIRKEVIQPNLAPMAQPIPVQDDRDMFQLNQSDPRNRTVSVVHVESNNMAQSAAINKAWIEEDDEDMDLEVDDLDLNQIDLDNFNPKSNAGVEDLDMDQFDSDEIADPFAEIEFENLDPQADLDHRFTKSFMRVMARLTPREEEDTIIGACKQLEDMIRDNPIAVRRLMTAHGVIPVMEMLEVLNPNIIISVLKLVNIVIGTDVSPDQTKFQQNMSLVGLIPAIIRFSSPGFPNGIRLEAANFVRHFCYANDFTRKMFISCGGLPVLVGFLQEPYQESKILVFNAIDCIRHVFQITSNPKNDFFRLFCKYGLLPSLAQALVEINEDRGHADAKEYINKIANVFLLFSNGDNTVKTNFAKPQVMETLLKLLPHLETDILMLILKSIRNVSMDSATLDLLESAGAIPVLIPFLDHPQPDIQNQVLLSVYYLSTISQSRQEQAAQAGVVPHLQRFIRKNHPLKQFALPIIIQLAKISSITRTELKKYDGVNFFLSLLQDSFWRTHALDSLATWLADDGARVEFMLAKSSNIMKLVQVMKRTRTAAQFEKLGVAVLQILTTSARVTEALGRSHLFVDELINRLTKHKKNNNIRINILKITTRLFEIPTNRDFIRRHNIKPVLENIAQETEAVIVAPLTKKLLKLMQA